MKTVLVVGGLLVLLQVVAGRPGKHNHNHKKHKQKTRIPEFNDFVDIDDSDILPLYDNEDVAYGWDTRQLPLTDNEEDVEYRWDTRELSGMNTDFDEDEYDRIVDWEYGIQKKKKSDPYEFKDLRPFRTNEVEIAEEKLAKIQKKMRKLQKKVDNLWNEIDPRIGFFKK